MGKTQLTAFKFLLSSILHLSLAGTTRSSSASASDDFQKIIQSTSEQAIQSFRLNPQNEEIILTELAQEVSDAAVNAISSFLRRNENINVDEITSWVSQEVETALILVQRSLNDIIDIDSIVVDMFDGLPDIVQIAMEKGTGSNIVQKKLEDLISRTFGPGLLGLISRNKSPNDPSSEVSLDVTSKEAQSEVQSKNGERDYKAIMQLLHLEDFKGVAGLLEQVFDKESQNDIIDAILAAIEDEALEPVLILALVELFRSEDFTVSSFSNVLGEAFKVNEIGVAKLIGKVIVEEKGQGMIDALTFALSQRGETMRVYRWGLALAIEDEGCTMFAQLLVEVSDKAEESGAGKVFEENVDVDNEISKCMNVGDELRVTVNILSTLNEPEEAYAVVLQAIDNNQDAAIAMSMIQGVDSEMNKEVISLLKLIFMDQTVMKDKLSLILSLTLSQGNSNMSQVILQSFEGLEELQLQYMAEAVLFAFSQGPADMKSSYMQLIEDSVQGDFCGMKSIIQIVLKKATKEDMNDVQGMFLNNDKLQACFDAKLLQQFAPKPEPREPLTTFVAALRAKPVITPISEPTTENVISQIDSDEQKEVPNNKEIISDDQNDIQSNQEMSLDEDGDVITSTSLIGTNQSFVRISTDQIPQTEEPQTTKPVKVHTEDSQLQDQNEFEKQEPEPELETRQYEESAILGEQLAISYSSNTPQNNFFGTIPENEQDEFVRPNSFFKEPEQEALDVEKDDQERTLGMTEKKPTLVQPRQPPNKPPPSSSQKDQENMLELQISTIAKLDSIQLSAATSRVPSSSNGNYQSGMNECIDVTPPGGFSCAQQAKFGKCDRAWMVVGNFCQKTCGVCNLKNSFPPMPETGAYVNDSKPAQNSKHVNEENYQGGIAYEIDTGPLTTTSGYGQGQIPNCHFEESLLVEIAKRAVEEVLQLQYS